MMRGKTPRSGPFRLTVSVWVGVWMLAIPFFHVHPEGDHRHGEDGHVHGGVVHTIWSPDLECEFDRHGAIEDTHDRFDGVVRGLDYFHVGDQHAEFSLTLLGDSSDRRQLLLAPLHPLTVAGPVLSEPDREARLEGPTAVRLRSLSVLYERPSRAPPALII